jgi:hypothetical protein
MKNGMMVSIIAWYAVLTLLCIFRIKPRQRAVSISEEKLGRRINERTWVLFLLILFRAYFFHKTTHRIFLLSTIAKFSVRCQHLLLMPFDSNSDIIPVPMILYIQ